MVPRNWSDEDEGAFILKTAMTDQLPALVDEDFARWKTSTASGVTCTTSRSETASTKLEFQMILMLADCSCSQVARLVAGQLPGDDAADPGLGRDRLDLGHQAPGRLRVDSTAARD